MTECGAQVADFPAPHRALLRLDDGRTIEAPLLDEMLDRCRIGSLAQVYFDRNDSLVGWYLPEAGIGLDLRLR